MLSSIPSLRTRGCFVRENCPSLQRQMQSICVAMKTGHYRYSSALSTCSSIIPFILHTRKICSITQVRRLACAQAQNPRRTQAHMMRNMCTGKRDTADKTENLKHPRHLTGVRSALTILAWPSINGCGPSFCAKHSSAPPGRKMRGRFAALISWLSAGCAIAWPLVTARSMSPLPTQQQQYAVAATA